MANIILTGMPGCGKSTVGPLLGRPFYDSDAEVERQERRTVAEIFDARGEDYFRRAESAVLARLCLLDGVTVATGGGVVTKPENMAALKQNGFVVFIIRPPELIDIDNADRPLLRSPQKWDQLYTERLPLYCQYADFTVFNDGTPEACAGDILKRMKNL